MRFTTVAFAVTASAPPAGAVAIGSRLTSHAWPFDDNPQTAARAKDLGLQNPFATDGHTLHSGRFAGMRVRPIENSQVSEAALHAGPSGMATSATHPFGPVLVFATAPLCHFKSKAYVSCPVLSSSHR